MERVYNERLKKIEGGFQLDVQVIDMDEDGQKTIVETFTLTAETPEAVYEALRARGGAP